MTVRILPTLAATLLLMAPALMTPATAQGGPPPLAPPPPAETQTDASWFAAIDGAPQGPFTREQVRDRGLAPDTLVWREGMQDWTPLAQVPELNAASAEVAVAPPPLPPRPEAAQTPPDTTEYFVEENGASSPPLTRDEIAQRIAAGSIDGSTLVWHEGMAEWAALDSSQLASLLPAAPPRDRADPVTPDAMDVIVGSWRGRVLQPVDGLPMPVEIDVTAVYGRDGKFSYTGNGMMDLRSQGVEQPVRLEIAIEGDWRAQMQAPNKVRANLSGTIRMSAPQLDLVETEPLEEVLDLEIIDRNTVRDDEGNVFSRAPG